MATNWRIYGKDTVACKLSKAELPGFFQKKIIVGPQEAALIVKDGKIQETVTQKKETVLGFWDRIKSLFSIETEVDVYIVDTTPVDLVVYLGKTDKGERSTTTGKIGPTETQASLRSRTDAGARAAGIELTGAKYSETGMQKTTEAMQEQRDVSDITLLALSADREVISAECRLRVSVALEDVRLLTNTLRGRAALSTWDLTALIKDELLAKVLLPRIGQLRSEDFRGNRNLLSTLESDVSKEMLTTFSSWGLTLENFVVSWGLTDLDLIEIDRKRQTRQEEALKFSHGRQLADMQRNLDIKVTEYDNLRRLKIAAAQGDEALKAFYASGEVERADIIDGKRLNVARVDAQITALQLDIKRQEEEIKFSFEKRRKELDADLERNEMQDLMKTFDSVQQAKMKRQQQEQDFMVQQMNTQSGTIERLVSHGLDKGVVDGPTIQEVARQFTMQKALDRTDARVDSLSQAEGAKANINSFKEAEDRERNHLVDLTSHTSKMMESAKQNVPQTLVQGNGTTPKFQLNISDTASTQQSRNVLCRKCGTPVRADWKLCAQCGEPIVFDKTKCCCGATIDSGWKLCPFCGNPVSI